MTAFAASPALVLMVGDDGTVAVPFGMKDAVPFFAANDDRQAQREITLLATRHAKARVTIAADNLAQDYRIDRLPRLMPFDRMRLLRRRLRASFPHAGLNSALRRKRGEYLMMGLQAGSPVLHWAERLSRHAPRIVLAPLEGARLLRRLNPDSGTGWAMLIARQLSGGYRQIVTKDGDLVFTRLTPLTPCDADGKPAPDEEAEAIARDVKASLDYLARHGLDDPRLLDITFLSAFGHDGAAFGRLGVGSMTIIPPHRVAQIAALSLAPNIGETHGDLLLAAAIAACRPVHAMRLPLAARQYRTGLIRKAGMIAAMICLGAALAFTSWQTRALVQVWRQADAAEIMRGKRQHELADLQTSAAQVTAPLARIRQALERKRIFAAEHVWPWHALDELAAADLPLLSRLDWKADEDGETLMLVWPVAKDSDRAAAVDAFNNRLQQIAQALPDYTVTSSAPPYPALPGETISAAGATEGDVTASVTLHRRTP